MFSRQYHECQNTLDWAPMNTNILREINDAMSDNTPIENIAMLTAVEMWHKTRNALWIRVWIELNKEKYGNTHMFADDLVEVFGF